MSSKPSRLVQSCPRAGLAMRDLYRSLYWRWIYPVLREVDLAREARGSHHKWRTIKLAMPYTMVGYKRLSNAYDLASSVEKANIPGAIVECGVFNGGCAAVMAAVLHRGSPRSIWLFDSFEGLPMPTEEDGGHALVYAGVSRPTGQLVPINRCVGDVDKVREIFRRLRISPSNIFIEKGWFQKTLPQASRRIGPIALLRVDADWYESTKLCLEYLYDQVAPGGYVVLDDFGYWEGCRNATLEFMTRRSITVKLRRIDNTGTYFQVPLR